MPRVREALAASASVRTRLADSEDAARAAWASVDCCSPSAMLLRVRTMVSISSDPALVAALFALALDEDDNDDDDDDDDDEKKVEEEPPAPVVIDEDESERSRVVRDVPMSSMEGPVSAPPLLPALAVPAPTLFLPCRARTSAAAAEPAAVGCWYATLAAPAGVVGEPRHPRARVEACPLRGGSDE